MRGQGSRRVSFIVIALFAVATAGWSQSIDDLIDGKTNADNQFLGAGAGFSLTTGIRNTGTGAGALTFNTTGGSNTANGYHALLSNTTGSDNTANGALALVANTTGSSNTANGQAALFSNTTGSWNTANGYRALLSNTTGIFNTANGESAMYLNTTGSWNTANGEAALFSNTTGGGNTADGYQALVANTTGINNTAVGQRALEKNTVGKFNVALGYLAGGSNVSGKKNVFLGPNAGNNANYATKSNRLVIANNAFEPLLDGNFTAKTLRINGAVTVNSLTEVSDVRLKTAIAPLQNGLASILALEAKTYQWRSNETAEESNTANRAIGLIAQEVETVLPELVTENEQGFKGIEYSKLTAVLVQAIKEQQKQIEAQQAQMETLRNRVAELELR